MPGFRVQVWRMDEAEELVINAADFGKAAAIVWRKTGCGYADRIEVYALDAAAVGCTCRSAGSTPATASTTALRCSGPVPQQPPTMRTP